MNIQKLQFHFKEALYTCFFIVIAFWLMYPLFNYFHFTDQKMTNNDIILGYLMAILVTTVINYFLKDYEQVSDC